MSDEHAERAHRSSRGRRDRGQSLSFWASQASGNDTIITNVATTFTCGTLLGRAMSARIHCGSVSVPGAGRERGDDDLVEAQREGQQAAGESAERTSGNVT